MVHDSVSDFIAIVNNAGKVKHVDVVVAHSKFKKKIAEILQLNGYISSFEDVEKNGLKYLRVALKYYDNKHVIAEFVRVSKPSNRVFVSADKMTPFRNGLGISIISTSKGLMTDKEAKKLGVGGEVVCLVF